MTLLAPEGLHVPRLVAPEDEALLRAGRELLALPDVELRAYLGGLDPEKLDVAERAIALAIGTGWRSSPSAMAHHLTAGRYRRFKYIEYLSQRFVDAVEGRSPRQIWNLPGRYGKSLLASQWGPVWAIDRTAGAAKIILVSYGYELAMENAVNVRDRLVTYSDELRGQLRADRRRRDRFVTEAGGGVLAAGLDSSITGFGAGDGGGIVVDDPFKNWQQAHSQARRDYVENQFKGTIRNRLDQEEAWIIVVHHRVHEDDLTARLVADTLNDDGDEWEVTALPALAVENDPLGRAPGEALEPERFTAEQCQARARGMGSYLACTPAETPILMADWTERPISEVCPGDMVVGFIAEPGHNVRYVPTRVTATAHAPGVVAEYRMQSGRTVRATRDHRWFVRSGRKYQRAIAGTPLRQVTEVGTVVTEHERALWSWLAGMIDGEGHIGRSKINVVQAVPRNRAVMDRLLAVLDELGVGYSTRYEPGKGSHSDRISVDIKRAGWVLRMCLEHTPLAKRDQAAASLYAGAGRYDRVKDYVVAIDADRSAEVYALATETGNYVAWGYASSNSGLEQQNPTPEEGNELLRAWFVLAESAELPRKADRAITSWDLKLKNRESGDYVVGQCWWRVGPAFFLMDQMRGRYDHATTANAIALLAVRHPEAKQHIIESAGSADEVIPELRKAIENYEVTDEMAARLGMNDEERSRVQALRRSGMGHLVPEPATEGSKPVRARNHIAPKAESGRVRLPADAEWVPALLDEIAAFPDGTHDDQVDAMSQALKKLSRAKVAGATAADYQL